MTKASLNTRMWMISLPALLAFGLLLSVGGLVVAGYVGRPATGERVTIHVASACASAWQERLSQRVAAIGLGDPEIILAGDVVQLTTTLPGNPDDRTLVPSLLTAPGRLTVHPRDGEPVATEADLVETRLSMSYIGRATVVLRPSDDAWERIRALSPDAVLVVTLDGASVELGEVRRVARDDELHIQPAMERAPDELRMAVDWSIILGTGPAPCAVTNLTVVDG